jgi:hypothetical protein
VADWQHMKALTTRVSVGVYDLIAKYMEELLTPCWARALRWRACVVSSQSRPLPRPGGPGPREHEERRALPIAGPPPSGPESRTIPLAAHLCR